MGNLPEENEEEEKSDVEEDKEDDKEDDYNDDEPDFNAFFEFLRDALEDEEVPLPNFYEFCRYLKIPLDIRALAKDLLKAKGEKLNYLKNKRKFVVYCASFFVAYVITRGDYSEYKHNFQEITRILSQKDHYIEYRVKIGKFLSTIFNDKFHGYLITDALDEDEYEEFYRKFYKIEIKDLFKMLKKNHRRIINRLDLDEFLDAFFYIMEKVYEDYEYSAIRICTISYFIISSLKIQKKTRITSNDFLYCSKAVPEVTRKNRFEDQDKLLKIQFEDNFKKIKEKIDYGEFVNAFPNLNLKASSDNENQMKQLSKVQMIKEQLRTRRWR